MRRIQFNKKLNNIIEEKCKYLEEYYPGYRKQINEAINEIIRVKRRSEIGGELTEVDKVIERECNSIVDHIMSQPGEQGV